MVRKKVVYRASTSPMSKKTETPSDEKKSRWVVGDGIRGEKRSDRENSSTRVRIGGENLEEKGVETGGENGPSREREDEIVSQIKGRVEGKGLLQFSAVDERVNWWISRKQRGGKKERGKK